MMMVMMMMTLGNATIVFLFIAFFFDDHNLVNKQIWRFDFKRQFSIGNNSFEESKSNGFSSVWFVSFFAALRACARKFWRENTLRIVVWTGPFDQGHVWSKFERTERNRPFGQSPSSLNLKKNTNSTCNWTTTRRDFESDAPAGYGRCLTKKQKCRKKQTNKQEVTFELKSDFG